MPQYRFSRLAYVTIPVDSTVDGVHSLCVVLESEEGEASIDSFGKLFNGFLKRLQNMPIFAKCACSNGSYRPYEGRGVEKNA